MIPRHRRRFSSDVLSLGASLLALHESDPTRFEALRAAKVLESRWPPFHYLISNANAISSGVGATG